MLGCTTFAAAVGAADSGVTTEARFLSHTRQLIFEGRRSGEGYFSPDGKVLIFQSEREPGNPFYQIYTLDFETGDIARVSPRIGKTTCSFFRPGSDEVLFSSTHLDPEAGAKQKAELEFRSSGQQRRYSWDYDEHIDIFSARRDGSNVRQLTTAPGYDAEAWFSPDGKRILWRRFSEKSDTADIFTMNLDGRGVRRLTDFGAMSWAPYFHPTLVMSSSQRTSWGSPINGRRSLHDYECA